MTGKHSTGEKTKVSPASRNCAGDGQTTKMPHMVTRLPISDLNQHLTCALCSGYMIDATTVVECLHSFCRSCLLRYLESSSTCPICDTQINKAQLDKCVRADHTLQDLVYKLVPGLYKSELRRRKDFYLDQCKSAADEGPSSSSSSVNSDSFVASGMQIFDKHLVELSAFICTPDEIISFSLENAPRKQQNELPAKSNVQNQSASAELDVSQQQKGKEIGKKMEDLHFKRYFRCPAAVTVGHLKKLLACKMDLSVAHQIEILHSDEPLLDEYTLMDIAYIYTWRRKAPMQLFFNICKYESEDEPMPLLEPEERAESTNADSRTPTDLVATTSSVDVKEDFTTSLLTSESSSTEPRFLDCIGLNGGKKLSNSSALMKGVSTTLDGSDFSTPNFGAVTSTPLGVNNFTSSDANTARRGLASVRDVLKSACGLYPTTTPASMRGKPPVPIHHHSVSVDQSNGLGHQKTTPMTNGKLPPIRLAISTPINQGKRKAKNDADNKAKQPKPRKPKPPKFVTYSPAILAALQKISGFIPPVSNPAITSPPSITKTAISLSSPASESTTRMRGISIDTVDDDSRSPVFALPSATSPDATAVSPLGAYKPTAAQSACTQPAKLRLKKSLSSVVQELSSNALEASSPSKKVRLENGDADEEQNGTLIH